MFNITFTLRVFNPVTDNMEEESFQAPCRSLSFYGGDKGECTIHLPYEGSEALLARLSLASQNDEFESASSRVTRDTDDAATSTYCGKVTRFVPEGCWQFFTRGDEGSVIIETT